MTRAAETLADILARENAALRARRPQDIAPLLAEKEAALADLARSDAAEARPAEALVTRLRALAAENEALLSEALAVQTQILALVARATRTALARHAPYGGRPSGRCAPPPPPLSMSKRF